MPMISLAYLPMILTLRSMAAARLLRGLNFRPIIWANRDNFPLYSATRKGKTFYCQKFTSIQHMVYNVQCTCMCMYCICVYIAILYLYNKTPHLSLPPSIPQESGRFSLPVLEQWLRANLTWNPFGPHALKCGARDKKCPCFRSENFGKIALNAVIAPGG